MLSSSIASCWRNRLPPVDPVQRDTFRLAYVAYTFPVLTQTFTTREVLALTGLGLDVRVYAAREDEAARLDDRAAAARNLTTYLPGAASAATLAALLRWCVRRPLRTFSVLVACLGGGYVDRPVWSRVRSVGHFLNGVALASRLGADGGVDRIHAQMVDAGSTVAYAAARLLDVPFSFMNHTAYNPFLLPAKALEADVIVSISEFDRRRVEKGAPAAAGKVVVSRVGICVNEWSGLPRRPESMRLLSVAALREKKGHDVLIRAAAALAWKKRPLHLVFAGDGARRGELERLARSEGVACEFLGAVGPEVVREELTRADGFVLACNTAANGDLDGIPVVLMEAMAAGVPVISTRLSGIPELVADGVTGYLAEPGDVDDLAATLERFLDGVEQRDEVVRVAGERVTQLHEIANTSRALAHILTGGRA